MPIQPISFLARLITANAELWSRQSESGVDLEDYQGGYEQFDDLLKDCYKLEYVYSMLKNKPFKGAEARKKNILRNVTRELQDVIATLGAVLKNIFDEWLSKHALNEPYAWAKERVSSGWDNGFEFIWENTVAEYMQYSPEFQNVKRQPGMFTQVERKFVNKIMQDPSLQELVWDLVGGKDPYVDQETEFLLEEWRDDPAEVTERLGLPEAATEDEIRDAAYDRVVENLDITEYVNSITDYFYNADPENVERFLIAVNEQFVFPLWFDKWEQEGIVETRENIQNISNQLGNPPEDLGKRYALVNLALNASHQTGAMLEHIQEYTGSGSLKYVLDSLSAGEFTKELDPILREAGVVL